MLQGLNRRFGNGLRLQAVQQAGQVGDGFTIQGANKGVKMLVIRSCTRLNQSGHRPGSMR